MMLRHINIMFYIKSLAEARIQWKSDNSDYHVLRTATGADETHAEESE